MVRSESDIMVGSVGLGVDCEGGAGGAPRLERVGKVKGSFAFGGGISWTV